MKNSKQEDKNLNKLNPEMRDRLHIMGQRLEELEKKNLVDESMLRELDNLVMELMMFRGSVNSNLYAWIKQGYLVD